MSALWIAGGVVLWALHFTSVYAIVTVACVYEVPHWAVLGIAGATIAALAAVVALVVQGVRRQGFIDWMTAAVAVAAGVAIVYEGLGIFYLPACP